MPLDLSTALLVAGVLLVLYIIIRVVGKVTHLLFTLGCLAVIVLVVLAAVFGVRLGF